MNSTLCGADLILCDDIQPVYNETAVMEYRIPVDKLNDESKRAVLSALNDIPNVCPRQASQQILDLHQVIRDRIERARSFAELDRISAAIDTKYEVIKNSDAFKLLDCGPNELSIAQITELKRFLVAEGRVLQALESIDKHCRTDSLKTLNEYSKETKPKFKKAASFEALYGITKEADAQFMAMKEEFMMLVCVGGAPLIPQTDYEAPVPINVADHSQGVMVDGTEGRMIIKMIEDFIKEHVEGIREKHEELGLPPTQLINDELRDLQSVVFTFREKLAKADSVIERTIQETNGDAQKEYYKVC
jgi:hypothetical protein